MPRRSLLASALCCVVCLPACARGGAQDAGQPGTDAASFDAGGRDTGPPPGVDSGPPPDSGPSPDSGPTADSGPPRDSGPTPDSGPPDGGPSPDSGGGGCTPAPDNMMITEVMVASQSGSSDYGEWFEVRNLGSCTLDLSGLVIESPTSTGTPVTHTVTSGLLTAGGFFLFTQSADPAENHGLSSDYAYGSGTSGVVLNNSGDELIIRDGAGTEIDRVAWGSTDYRHGAARQLTRGSTGDNFDLGGSAWCDATDVYSSASGGPYLGTPGALNQACP